MRHLQRLREWLSLGREALGELLRKHRQGSIFRIFLVSYLAILIIPLILGGICYFKAFGVVAEESAKYNRAMLGQARQAIDTQIEALKQLSVDIARDPLVQALMYETNPREPKLIYQMVSVTQKISNDEGLNPFLDSIYIYFKKSRMILTHSGKYTPEFFYESQTHYADLSYAQWLRTLDEYHDRDFLPVGKIMDNNGASHNVITYICSLPLDARQSRLAALVALINEEKINNLLADIETLNRGVLYVLDQNNRVLIALGDRSFRLADPGRDLAGGKDTFYRRLDGRNVAVSFVESDYSGWKYVAIVPTEVFMSKVNYIRTLTIGIFVLSLIMGLLMAYLLAIRNYRPLKSMVDHLSTELSIEIPEQNNEYASMQRIFDDLVRRSNKFKGIIDGHVRVLQYYYPMDIENRLIINTKTGDYAEVKRILDGIFNENLSDGQMSLDIARCLFFDIVSTAIKVVSSIKSSCIAQYDLNPIAYLLECENVAEMKAVVHNIFLNICESVNKINQVKHNNRVIDEIKKYITQNYTDINLGLTTISEALSLTSSYISRFFKEQTNQSIVDYINMTRVSNAKQLLIGTLRISDIAQRVGYSSDDALIKAFRKYAGVTPGRYREIIAKNGDNELMAL
ncbi:MAG: AraC family transcriptional regulator [Bacteroidota bacterium]